MAKKEEREEDVIGGNVPQHAGLKDGVQEDTPLLRPNCEEWLVQTRSLKEARRLLYVSHVFARFSEVAWQFSLALFLAAFTNYESLVLVSTYGLVSGVTVCVAGGQAGRFVDRSCRLHAARVFIWSQNGAVLLATLCCYLLLSRSGTAFYDENQLGSYGVQQYDSWIATVFQGVPLDFVSVLLLVGVHVLGSLAGIVDKGFMVAIERDWVVVMSTALPSKPSSSHSTKTKHTHKSDSHQGQWLSQTNVAMRQIDLTCKVLAPSMAGFIIQAFGNNNDLRIAVLLVGILNVASLLVEYACTAKIYHMVPALANKKITHQPVTLDRNHLHIDPEKGQKKANKTSQSSSKKNKPSNLRIYFQQSVAMAGLALSFLYLNIISFGSMMTAYLISRNMHLDVIGFWRGISSAVGLLGTIAYHQSVSRISLSATGQWSVLYEFLCLTACYASLYVHSERLSLVLLIGGTCASRVGLWVFDITVTQLMQMHVVEEVRGVVGGVQHSMNAFFGLVPYVVGMVFPDPKDFGYLIALGYGGVGLAVMLYSVGITLRKNVLQ